MKRMLPIAPLLLVIACEATQPLPFQPNEPPLPTPAQDTCNAAQYASLIGQDATALERVLLLGQVRVIRPGQAVTEDFRPERINFYVGSDNRITKIRCT